MSNNIELNDDWKYVRLPELADMKNGGTPSKKQSTYWKNGTIPFVTAADLISPYVNNGRSHLTEEGLKSGKTVICEPGDLLIGTRTRVGNCSICKKIMGASQDITRIRFKQKVVPEYFSWFFKNIGNDLSFFSQGTSIQGITRKMLLEIKIPVPPIKEQRRIVSRIEELTSRVEKAKEILKEVEQEIDNFTPSLLAKAFRGDL